MEFKYAAAMIFCSVILGIVTVLMNIPVEDAIFIALGNAVYWTFFRNRGSRK